MSAPVFAKKNFPRHLRVAELIHAELALIIRRYAQDPRLQFVTLTRVDVSPDLKNAKVFFSLLNEAELKQVQTALNHACSFFRQQLAAQLSNLRVVPTLKFVFDDSIIKGNRIEQLLREDDIPPQSED